MASGIRASEKKKTRSISTPAQSSCPLKSFTPFYLLYRQGYLDIQELVFIALLTMNASNPDLQNLWVCQGRAGIISKGYFYGQNPLSHTTPAVLAQLSLSSLCSVLLQYILTPLGESAFVSLLLVKLSISLQKESKNLVLVISIQFIPDRNAVIFRYITQLMS